MAYRIRIHAHGGPDVLQVENWSPPSPEPGQVRVAISAAGVNYFDTQFRSGLYPQSLPCSLGFEGAGLIEALGEGVDSFAVGDRVAWILVPGSYASHLIVPQDRLVRVPDDISLEVAAAVLFQGMTAHYLAHSTFPLSAGKFCLIHSAAGGVGLLLCQMAKAAGATVVALTSTQEKAALAREAGADHALTYQGGKFADRVRACLGGRGVDVVYDAVGQATFDENLAVLVRRGTLAIYGEASGVVPPIDIRILSRSGSISLVRTSLGDYCSEPEEYRWRADDILQGVRSGALRVKWQSFPLAEMARAHAALEARITTGKVICSVD